MKLKGKIKDQDGFSLVETMIAVLLIAIVVTSVFSLAFTAKVSSIKTARRATALLAIRQAQEKLKAYVTADLSIKDPPNSNWRMPEDVCGPDGVTTEATCSAGCSAFDLCRHNVTLLIPEQFRGPPINMRMYYDVLKDKKDDTDEAPRVVFKVNWDD